MPVIYLNAEQLQLVKIVNDHTLRFPLNESGDAELLQTCYDFPISVWICWNQKTAEC